MKPKQGAFAYCSKNKLGFITSKKPDSKGAWSGENVDNPGKRWSSKCPKVVGYVKGTDTIDRLGEHFSFDRRLNRQWPNR